MPAKLISGLIAVLSSLVLCTPVVAQAPPPNEDPGPLRMHHARVAHTATVLADGSVLIVGGTDGWTALASAEVYDPATRQFHVVGDLRKPRMGHAATLLADGRVLITGGVRPGAAGSSGVVAAVEVFDPATGMFSRVGKLAEPRHSHTATLLDDGRVLVAGGQGRGARVRPLRSAEIFDPASGNSQSVKPMHGARMGHAAVPLDSGRIAIIGGFGLGAAAERTLERFDPARQRFVRAPKLAAPLAHPEAVRLDDGRILAVSSPSVVIAADTRSSERLASGPDAAGQPTATRLRDGRVVVIAGNGSEPAQVSLFDPARDSFEQLDPMQLDREAHVAVALADGTVLVIGGISCMRATDTAELWDPATMTSVAVGSAAECDPTTMFELPPLPSLGGTTTGGRIELPGSAFAITVPDDWSVELAEPDADVFTAQPGSAWEALRATAPDRSLACSVSVGVSEVSLRKRSGTGSGSVTAPRWDSAKRWLLLVPTPRVEDSATSFSSSSPIVRLAREHGGLEHDALYALECAGGRARDEQTFETIRQTFEFLPVPG